MSIHGSLKIELWGAALLLLGACGPAAMAQIETGNHSPGPIVLSPAEGQRIGDGDDPFCPATRKACNKIRAEGRVPEGLTPFFGVEPVQEGPTMWIQPEIRRVRADGSFSGLIHLGEKSVGIAEHFKIYVLACESAGSLERGDTILDPPEDCLVSAPVEVYRVR